MDDEEIIRFRVQRLHEATHDVADWNDELNSIIEERDALIRETDWVKEQIKQIREALNMSKRERGGVRRTLLKHVKDEPPIEIAHKGNQTENDSTLAKASVLPSDYRKEIWGVEKEK